MGSKELLKMARELDEMTRDVLPEEADLLEEVLKKLKTKKFVPSALSEEIKKLYEKYLHINLEEAEDGVNAMAEESDVIDEEVEE